MLSQCAQEKPTTIIALPPEVLKIILAYCQLGGFLSARAASKVFYDVSLLYPSSLIRDIVICEIGIAALREDVQLPKASLLRRQYMLNLGSRFNLAGFYREHKDALLSCCWSLSDGIAAVRLHSIVENFASDFASQYLSELQKQSQHNDENPPSAQELDRIKRALYRFEAYCNLFPPTDKLEDHNKSRETQMSFLFSFSPWEREQIASIHESLWRRIAPAFNDLVLHDVYWGAFNTSYADEFDNLQTEWVLSRGLRSIYDISRAETFAQRHQLLGRNVPTAATDFLHEAFACCNFMVLQSDSSSRATSTYQQPNRLLDCDPDPGPEKAWKWSHPDGSRAALTKEAEYASERACGYVFWDEERLERSGLLDNDWVDTIIKTDESVIAMAPTLEEQMESWDVRSALFRQGVLGYWEKGG